MRETLKRYLPTVLRNRIIAFRASFAAPPIDDVVLREFTALPDPSQVPRLSLVIPNISAATTFGGVTTGLDIFFRTVAELRKSALCDVRVILSEPARDTDPSILQRWASRHGIQPGDLEITQLPLAGPEVSVRRAEVFFPFNWWCLINLRPIIGAQARAFGLPPAPLVYLIQEYEPQFEPFSSAHMLARDAYSSSSRVWGIFNSSSLRGYFELLGHRVEHGFTFEPVVNDALRPFLAEVGVRPRKPRLIVYGRPTAARNCFPAVVRGLRQWSREYPEFSHWDLISAGTMHKPIKIDRHRQLVSVGKLELEQYADLMLTSSAGVGLMASPHPSYPPLEMAHFGLRTVTNTYTCKDLSGFHPNIISVDSLTARALAGAMARAARLSVDPVVPYENPDFVRSETYPFMSELVSMLRDHLADCAR